MAKSLAKQMAGAKPKKPVDNPQPTPAPSSQKTRPPCLLCDRKLQSSKQDLPLCKTCEEIARESVTEAPSDTLRQMFKLAKLVKDYLRWTHEDPTPMAQLQLSNLHTRARQALSANYPLALSKEGVRLRSFQDHLTEAFKVWMLEAHAKDKSMLGIMGQLMNTFKPINMNIAVSQLQAMPTGYITIPLDRLQKQFGIETPDVGRHQYLAIELKNLFAMLDENYAGSLACTLEEDPHGADQRTTQ